jgi:hypothetical protein
MSVVNISPLAGILTIFLVAVTPAWAADSLSIERLGCCRDLCWNLFGAVSVGRGYWVRRRGQLAHW